MVVKGRVYKFGDDINTDEIIPARYLNTSDPEELAKHVMEDADADFPNKVKKGDIIVAGKNFGCGSSREHAPIAIKASGVACVVAKSFARIFYRNAFNIGLRVVESNDIDKIEDGDEIEIDFDNGKIKNLKNNSEYKIKPYPAFMKSIIESGGLMLYIVNKVRANEN